MPKKPTPKLVAWSYSRFDTYDKCPHQALHKYVLKTKTEEKEGKALVRGRDVHNTAEAYVDAERKPRKMPTDLKLFEEEFLALRTLKKSKDTEVFTEQQWAFDLNWQVVDWYADRAWCRIKTDATILDRFTDESVRVIDYKTGKIRTGHEKQLELYAVGAFARFEWAHTVNAELWFLDQGEIKEIEFKRGAHYTKIRKRWESRVRRILADRIFKPKPDGYVCNWCPYAKKRGGPCKHGDK
jgi:RecB family exonuclease